ncbi:MAG: alpha/beta hydrolase [Gemmatimonadetes bacterium]|nr:alpha/beta hydrolase [Gemmatimonadota bacterium]
MSKWKHVILQISAICLALLIPIPASAQTDNLQPFKVQITGSGHPMILIPGLSSSGDVWRETVSRYQNSFECHVFTLAGFAGQPPVQTDHYLQTMRDALIAYIQENDLKKPILAGHSLGGFLSLWVAASIPESVGSLIIVDAVPFLPALQNPAATVEFMRAPAEQTRAWIRSQTPEQREKATPSMLKMMITDPAKIDTAVVWSLSSDPNTVAQAMYEIFLTDLRTEIKKIQTPVLVLGAWVSGQSQGATRESSLAAYQKQYDQVEKCEIWMTDTGKHFIMWDDPEGYFTTIDAFLARKTITPPVPR